MEKTEEARIRELENLRKRIAELEKSDTARKKIEQELHELESRYQTTLDSMGDAIHVVDRNLRLLVFNRFFKRWIKKLGLELATNAIGQTVFDLFPFLPSKVRDEYEVVISTGKMLVTQETTTVGDNHIVTETRKIPVFEGEKVVRVVTCIRDITEQKKAVEALRESELRYRALFDRGLLCIYVHDFEGKFLDANDAALKLFGYSREEIPSINFTTLLSEDQLPKALAVIDEIIHNGYQKHLSEYKLTRKDGSYIWVEAEATLLYQAGEPYAVQGIARDITERTKAEEALKKSEAKYRTLVEQSLQGIVIVQDFRIVFANKAFAEIYGYSIEKLLSLPPEKVRLLVHPEDQLLVWGGFKERLQGKPITPHYEYRGIRKDGSLCWLDMFANLVTFRGKPAVQAAVKDITEHRQMKEAHRESEQKYKTLADNINVGIYRNTVGPKGQFIEANPAIVKMFGYVSKDEFLSTNVSDLYQNPEDRKMFNEKMLKCGFVKDEDLRLKKKDGTPFFGSVSAVAVKNENGEVTHYDGIIEDTTQHKKAEEQLQQTLEKLQRTISNTLEAMAKILESKDPYTAGHQKRVAQLVLAVAMAMKLPEEQTEGIHVAALIHDIGKIYVPAEILSRPAKLTASEFALIKCHPKLGHDILRTIEFRYPIADIILQHHERMDGSGYPNGLKNEEICLDAKILAVADVIEAMSAHRPYRPARSLETTLEEMSRNKGILYDSKIVDVCLKLFNEKGFQFRIDGK